MCRERDKACHHGGVGRDLIAVAAFITPSTGPGAAAPRTKWDGKPDFSGVYWPDATIAPPPVPLESLYRPEARDYREGGGAARGLIDWRGIDTPNHCWPPSPVEGSMAESVNSCRPRDSCWC